MEKVAVLADGMAQAASDFLNALSAEQRSVGSLRFGDEEERRRWFYTPTPRVGLRLGDLAPRQQQKVMQLMATGLSERGYNYASLLMGLENVVDRSSNFPDRTYGDLPDTRLRDPANYFVAVFGTPGDESGWSWRIGGHHLSLHYTVRDGLVYPTPAFFGAEPARSMLPGGVVLRPLAAGRGLRPRAPCAPVARATGAGGHRAGAPNRHRADEQASGRGRRDADHRWPRPRRRAPPHGPRPDAGAGRHGPLFAHAEGTARQRHGYAAQRDALVRLVRAYLDHLPDEIVDGYTALLEPDSLQALVFAWAGSPEPRAPHYYRVQSDDLLIEYDCTQNDANHTHSVIRNPRGDFGSDPLALHYAESHHP